METEINASSGTALLEVRDVVAGYGRSPVLQGISMSVNKGEVVALIGANGAGKTTLMSTLLGRIRQTQGQISFVGNDLGTASVQSRVRQGLVLVPEGREPLKPLNVEENLLVARPRTKRNQVSVEDLLSQVYELFPRLAERRKQQAGSMSGGEQQMLAIGRAIMSQPRLLMLDEPSLGLAPVIVDTVFEALGKLRDSGLSMLLVEQDAFLALEFADRGYVMESGSLVLQGPAKELAGNPTVQESYLGLG
ncbi:MAG: ABC transporter ATP-binding protein [Paeniglutamicibacter sp.]